MKDNLLLRTKGFEPRTCLPSPQSCTTDAQAKAIFANFSMMRPQWINFYDAVVRGQNSLDLLSFNFRLLNFKMITERSKT